MSIFAFTRRLALTQGQKWRRRRYERFRSLCRLSSDDRILDVGSGAGGALAAFNKENPITAVDLERWPNDPDRPNVTFVQGDGTALPFPDRSFDVAFSNSVIEHMDADDQKLFARELRRIADRYYVQTPNRWFPIEPHWQLPFFQFLPERVQRSLANRFQLGWHERGSFPTIRLLTTAELRALFPDAEIHRERLFGLTKSMMAVRRS